MNTLQSPAPVIKSMEPNLNVLGVQVNVLLRAEETGDQFSTYICLVPPGGGPPPHVHDGFDEAFLVLEGELEVVIGDELRVLKVNDTAFVPRGRVHTFRNGSSNPARFMGTATPGGHERFFFDADQLGPNDPVEAVVAVCRKHGIEVVLPRMGG